MKFTVAGFDQKYALTLIDNTDAVDCNDLFVLRTFTDLIISNKFTSVNVGNNRFYCVRYKDILDQLPILHETEKDVQRRFNRLVKFGILNEYRSKEKDTIGLYDIGENYKHLVC